MPITKPRLRKSIHQEAFDHYLRTGERLTNAEWLARHERKFNPYHDEIGRFTSPPGVTVSYGRPGRSADRRIAAGKRSLTGKEGAGGQPGNRGTEPAKAGNRADIDAAGSPKRALATREAVNTVIKDSWAPAAPIVSHWDLDRRQAYLDALRQKAGPNATDVEKAAFEETQRRLDAARRRLAEGDRIADREIVKLARTGLPPVDTGLSAVSLLSGEGDLGDVFHMATTVPIIGGIGKLARLAMASRAAGEVADISRIMQLGGAYRDLRGLPGYEVHHAPGKAVSRLSAGDGPAIAMLKDDHRRLVTSYRGREGDAFRKAQSEYIARGDVAAAIQMDIDHIRSLFGSKYDDAINQMLIYSRRKGFFN